MPVIAINKTCTLTSRSRLESYKRLVSVSYRLVKPTSRSRLGLELSRLVTLVPIPAYRSENSDVYNTDGSEEAVTICALRLRNKHHPFIVVITLSDVIRFCEGHFAATVKRGTILEVCVCVRGAIFIF